MTVSQRIFISPLVCLGVIGLPTALAAMDKLEAKGFAILSRDCARCHAIATEGDSPHPEAPPFRNIVTRYPVEDLEEALAEGIVSGHPDMPEFTFEADEIGAIVAYFNTLKSTK